MVTEYNWFFELLIWIPPTLMAISWRETTKAWICHYRGDPTIQSVGGTSFAMQNLDPVGSALAPVLLTLGKSSVYGWANPTDIRPNFLKNGNIDATIAVCAAFLTNFIMAVIWIKVEYFAKHIATSMPTVSEILLIAAEAGVHINVMLIAIHLLPIPPLDMSYLVRSHLPRYTKAWYIYFDPIGQPLIFVLFIFNIAPTYLAPLVKSITEQVLWASIFF